MNEGGDKSSILTDKKDKASSSSSSSPSSFFQGLVHYLSFFVPPLTTSHAILASQPLSFNIQFSPPPPPSPSLPTLMKELLLFGFMFLFMQWAFLPASSFELLNPLEGNNANQQQNHNSDTVMELMMDVMGENTNNSNHGHDNSNSSSDTYYGPYIGYYHNIKLGLSLFGFVFSFFLGLFARYYTTLTSSGASSGSKGPVFFFVKFFGFFFPSHFPPPLSLCPRIILLVSLCYLICLMFLVSSSSFLLQLVLTMMSFISSSSSSSTFLNSLVVHPMKRCLSSFLHLLPTSTFSLYYHVFTLCGFYLTYCIGTTVWIQMTEDGEGGKQQKKKK